jgi:transmembrane sensor
MSEIPFQTLLDKYLTHFISEEERILLQQMLEVPAHRQKLEAILDKELQEHAFEIEEDSKLLSLIQDYVQNKIRVERKPAKIKAFYIKRLVAAAVIFLLMGAGAYMLFTSAQKPNKELPQHASAIKPALKKNYISPGGNRAILKLSDGTVIVLDSANEGMIAQQGSVKIIKLNNGRLSYNALTAKSTETLYNTIITPRGGQYQLILSDGSEVWLNAASSLRFPASFTGGERNVELTGEGYFEIAKNATMPFNVKINDINIKVLGTRFNVNAYTDETFTSTTLLEGSVKISKSNKTMLLKPGQQAQAGKTKEIKVNDNVNLDEVVAWKNGLFQFKRATIETILRQAARWYDVEFDYYGDIPDRFSGQISRNVNASQLLQILELTGKAHFEIKERKIVVRP